MGWGVLGRPDYGLASCGASALWAGVLINHWYGGWAFVLTAEH